MKFFLSLLTKIVFLLTLVIAHFFISYSFAFPYNTINIIFAALILFMVFSETGVIVWMSFFMHFCIELYSISPFGVILLSSTLSILFTYWLFQTVFTNRSWYSTIFLTFVSLFFYRFLSLLFLFLIFFFFQKSTEISWGNMLILSGYELFFTEILVLISYAFLPKFRKSLIRVRSKVL